MNSEQSELLRRLIAAANALQHARIHAGFMDGNDPARVQALLGLARMIEDMRVAIYEVRVAAGEDPEVGEGDGDA